MQMKKLDEKKGQNKYLHMLLKLTTFENIIDYLGGITDEISD
jgi:hypothetical protein